MLPKMVRRRLGLRDDAGMAMITVILMGLILMSVVAVSTNNALGDLNNSTRELRRSTSFQAAEAGVDDYVAKLTEDHSYYLHYVHPAESTRSAGGTSVASGQAWNGAATWTYPTHQNSWRVLGNGYLYNLEVTPPSVGSPTITIVATGKAPGTTGEKRKIEVIVRTGSIADFQMISNADISYSSAATTRGKIYAGIDSGGVAHTVTHSGDAYGSIMGEGGVFGTTPARLFNNAKVYGPTTNPNIRSVVQTPINFNNFTESFVNVRAAAGSGGILLDDNTKHAWRLTFTSAGTITIDTCMRVGSFNVAESAPVCTFNRTANVPINGAIYVAQTAIVQGIVDGQATVVSNGDVVIGNDITYELTANDVLGLIAKNSVLMAQWSPNSLTVRAAVIAQTGQYRSWTSTNVKTGTFTHNGAVATNLGGFMSMFSTRVYNYDDTLLFLQPPYFPVLEESYTVLDFRELAS